MSLLDKAPLIDLLNKPYCQNVKERSNYQLKLF